MKPSNILVTADGNIQLLDFGIAKPVDGATDVYALGLLLFELLTGTHPWLGSDTPVLQALRTVLLQPAPIASRKAVSEPDPPVAAASDIQARPTRNQ